MTLRDILPDIQKIQMGIQNQQITALLCALLDHAGGSVTLSREEVERVHDDPHLNFQRHEDGSLTLSLAK